MSRSLASAGLDGRPQVTRRRALIVAGTIGLGTVVAACSGDNQNSASSATGVTDGLSSSVPSDTSPSSTPAGTSPAGTSPASSAVVVLDDATSAKLDAVFDSTFTATGVAGMSAAVWIGDTEWKRTTGYANLADKTPFRPTDHVRIASITKSYTATATLQLVDAGKLALTDSLESFVPGVANGPQITVRDLLGMTSGIYDFTADDAFGAAFTADPTMAFSDADALAIIAKHDPLFAPGSEVSYADSNYLLLGMIIAKITGTPAGQVITDAVISKLALPNTSYPTTSVIPDPHPAGYVPTKVEQNKPFDNAANPPLIVDQLNPAVPSTAGAMISTLDELRVWGNEIATGTLLSPATQALRLTSRPFPGMPINLGYGLGCETINEFVGHNGAIFGYSSIVMRRPQADVTIAAVANESTNSTTPASSFAYAVIKELYPDQWV